MLFFTEILSEVKELVFYSPPDRFRSLQPSSGEINHRRGTYYSTQLCALSIPLLSCLVQWDGYRTQPETDQAQDQWLKMPSEPQAYHNTNFQIPGCKISHEKTLLDETKGVLVKR